MNKGKGSSIDLASLAATVAPWANTAKTGQVEQPGATQPAAKAAEDLSQQALVQRLQTIQHADQTTRAAEQLRAVKQFAVDRVTADPARRDHFLKEYQAELGKLLTNDQVLANLNPTLASILTDPSEKARNQAGLIKGDMQGLVITDAETRMAGKAWLATQPKIDGKAPEWNAKTAAAFFKSDQAPKTANAITLSDEDIKDMPLEVRAHMTLDDSVLFHPLFHPATTDLPNTTKAEMFNATFRDMKGGTEIYLSEGTYHGVAFEDVKDVIIRIGVDEEGNRSRTIVNDLNIEGMRGEIQVSSLGVVNGIQSVGANFLLCNMEPGATIVGATIGNGTISMDSKMAGTNWVDATFQGTGLRGVNLSGAILTNATFLDADLDGLNLNGATIRNQLTIGNDTYTTLAEINAALLREGVIIDPNQPLKLEAHATATEGREQDRDIAVQAEREPKADNTLDAAVASIAAIAEGAASVPSQLAGLGSKLWNAMQSLNEPQQTASAAGEEKPYKLSVLLSEQPNVPTQQINAEPTKIGAFETASLADDLSSANVPMAKGFQKPQETQQDISLAQYYATRDKQG